VITKRNVFVTDFCRQYMMVFLTQNLHFLMMKVGLISLGISVLSNRYCSSINLRQISEVQREEQKIGVCCAITATQIVGPIFF
jgi:hypothetical protein